MPWFKEWFNSPYYHKLYGKRDHKEAETFISHLLNYLQPQKDWRFLDLACGKGRHASQIAAKGFDTYGVDLSPESIESAKSMAGPLLHFDVHDMRQVYKQDYFDVVLNLFTSFGYFDQPEDNVRALKSVKANLKKNAWFVQDYFNAEKVKASLRAHETKTIDAIDFEINKHIEDKKVIKHIRFVDQGVEYRFCEVVSLFNLDDFKAFYADAGFEIVAVFGDYNLQAFDAANSDRLILISKAI